MGPNARVLLLLVLPLVKGPQMKLLLAWPTDDDDAVRASFPNSIYIYGILIIN